MQAQEVSLIRLIEGEKQYQVPLYQRTYSWKASNRKTLWEDLEAQRESLASREGGSGHFLGSVVLAPSPRLVAGGLQQWLVIDGQQRLTTIMLALAALRDAATECGGQKQAARIQDQCLKNRHEDGDQAYRLLPTQADRHDFIACIDGRINDAAEGNILDAYNFFWDCFGGSGLDDLREYEEVIKTRLDFVSIAAEREDNPFRIFESLNNTGMRLTQGDLLRNYIFMLLPNHDETVYRETWLPMQSRIGADNLDTLAYLDVVMRGNGGLSKGNTYKEQQVRLSRLKDESAVLASVRELNRRSIFLSKIQNPTLESNTAVRHRLARLTSWGGETVYPIAMLALERRDLGIDSDDDVVAALRIAESFLVRRMLIGRTAAGVNRVFTQLPREMENVDNFPEALKKTLSGPRRYWATDGELRDAVRARPFYGAGKAGQRIFILRRLEESFGHKELLDWDASGLSIEHVLPQHPTPDWFGVLRSDVADGQNEHDLHRQLLDVLGNLTLTAYNSELSNRPFEEKKERLRTSNLSMNIAIANRPRWGKDEIVGRGMELADRAVKIWPGPDADIADFINNATTI